MATKLFVGGLSWDTTDDSLRQAFAAIGNVVSAQVITDKYTGKSRGFGFVEMGSDEDAQRAVQEMNGKQLDGRSIVVNEARPMTPRDNAGGGGYRGGGGGGRGGFGGGRGGRGGGHGGGGYRDNRGDDRGGRNW